MDVPAGWPCALLSQLPPSVADNLSDPTAEILTPQVIAATPRGAAWGTDEYGDGTGASPVQRAFWSALAGHAAALYASAFALAVQAFPSAVSTTLPDWENEYGLPDPCLSPASGTLGRVNSIRSKFASVGGSSLAYYYCLATSLGYDITITEPSQFICDFSVCDGEDEVSNLNIHDTWFVSFVGDTLTFFRPDEGVVDETPLEGFLIPSDLECIFRRSAPEHTTLIFAYA
jgi:uncharacterized protein YmfQ (DUF2313 family)